MALALWAAASATEWWNADWTARREVVLHAVGAPVPQGAVVRQPVLMPLGDPAAWRLAYQGREIPLVVVAKREGHEIVFRAAAEIARGSSDRYHLYYDNAAAPAREWTLRDIYAVYVDFRRDEVALGGWEVRRTEEGLQIVGTAEGPEEVRYEPRGPALDGLFEAFVTFVPPSGRASVRLGLRMQQQVQEADDALRARVAELIEQLGADSWQEREAAQAELIRIGPPALPQLRDAAGSGDPEVAARAQFAIRTIEEGAAVGTRTLAYGQPEGQGVAMDGWVEAQTGGALVRLGVGGQPVTLRIVRTVFAERPALRMYASGAEVGRPTVPPPGPVTFALLLREEDPSIAEEWTLVEFGAGPIPASPPGVEICPAERRP